MILCHLLYKPHFHEYRETIHVWFHIISELCIIWHMVLKVWNLEFCLKILRLCFVAVPNYELTFFELLHILMQYVDLQS